MKVDYSTLNISKVMKLPVHTLPPSYHYDGERSNSGSTFSPPGYPSNFTTYVYTQYGNTPPRGASMVIILNGIAYIVESTRYGRPTGRYTQHMMHKVDLERLYLPLPIDHPRVQAWIARTYAHQNRCYVLPEGVGPSVLGAKHTDRMFIYPVPDYKLKSFRDDPRFSEEWREAEKRYIDRANNDIERLYSQYATDDSYLPVQTIRKYYPEYQMDWSLVENPPARPGDWWAKHDVSPTEGECPGLIMGTTRIPHGQNSWCQFCGATNSVTVEERVTA